MTASEAFMEELANRVADKVEARLRERPTVKQRLYSIADAAIYMGRTEKGVRHLVDSGQIPKVSGDARVMLDIKDIDIWIANNKRRGQE